MATQITITDIPDEVRDGLAAQAARRNQNLDEFLRAELERIASRQSIADWLQSRGKSDNARVPASAILRARDADRK